MVNVCLLVATKDLNFCLMNGRKCTHTATRDAPLYVQTKNATFVRLTTHYVHVSESSRTNKRRKALGRIRRRHPRIPLLLLWPRSFRTRNLPCSASCKASDLHSSESTAAAVVAPRGRAARPAERSRASSALPPPSRRHPDHTRLPPFARMSPTVPPPLDDAPPTSTSFTQLPLNVVPSPSGVLAPP